MWVLWGSGGVWGVHGGEDAHHFGPLRGGDVLRHVHDGVHGHLGVRLNQTERWTERKERKKKKKDISIFQTCFFSFFVCCELLMLLRKKEKIR